MKRFALTLVAIASVAALATSVQAADGYNVWYGARMAHVADHAVLAHSAQHRQAAHHNAHHNPLTYYQHRAVHGNLNHQASHDRARHHAAHDYGTYGQVYGGHYGVQSSGRYYGSHGVSIRTPIGSLWLHH